jgi:DNA-binding transcriptional LysR family regulator
MDRLHLMNVFVAVAQEQGFAAAARRLNLSAPAVTRAVASLEESLGVKLLNRTTRIVRATEAGLRYLDDAQRIIAQVQAADAAAAGINSAPKGHLAVTAPVMFGRLFVIPGIVDYLQRYPDTQVDALFLDRVVNLLEEGLDVGIRIGELADSSMRALRVGQVRHIVCASPGYLDRHGIPHSPQDLMSHTIISSSAAQSLTDWRFNDSSVRIEPRLTVTSNDAAIAAVKDGLGITRLLSYQVAESVAAGELKILLERFEPAPIPVSIVHRQGRFASAKVRAFIDLMAHRLRAHKALN